MPTVPRGQIKKNTWLDHVRATISTARYAERDPQDISGNVAKDLLSMAPVITPLDIEKTGEMLQGLFRVAGAFTDPIQRADAGARLGAALPELSKPSTLGRAIDAIVREGVTHPLNTVAGMFSGPLAPVAKAGIAQGYAETVPIYARMFAHQFIGGGKPFTRVSQAENDFLYRLSAQRLKDYREAQTRASKEMERHLGRQKELGTKPEGLASQDYLLRMYANQEGPITTASAAAETGYPPGHLGRTARPVLARSEFPRSSDLVYTDYPAVRLPEGKLRAAHDYKMAEKFDMALGKFFIQGSPAMRSPQRVQDWYEFYPEVYDFPLDTKSQKALAKARVAGLITATAKKAKIGPLVGRSPRTPQPSIEGGGGPSSSTFLRLMSIVYGTPYKVDIKLRRPK